MRLLSFVPPGPDDILLVWSGSYSVQVKRKDAIRRGRQHPSASADFKCSVCRKPVKFEPAPPTPWDMHPSCALFAGTGGRGSLVRGPRRLLRLVRGPEHTRGVLRRGRTTLLMGCVLPQPLPCGRLTLGLGLPLVAYLLGTPALPSNTGPRSNSPRA